VKDTLNGRQRYVKTPSTTVSRSDLARVVAQIGSGVYEGTVDSYDAVADEAYVKVEGLQTLPYLNYTGVALVAGAKVLVTTADNQAVVVATQS
jgi:hypothetical protein